MNPPTLDSLSHWLLRTSFEASLLIVAVLALRWALGRRLPPAWRIGLWVVVGVKLLLPAFIPAGFGLGQWWQAPKGEAVVAAVAPVRAPPVAVATQEAAFGGAAVESAPPAAAEISWRKVLLGLWALGALGVLGAGLARQWRFARLLRMRPFASDARLRRTLDRLTRMAGVHSAVPVVLMPPGTTPAVVGGLRARLLLPEDWEARFDQDSLRHILLHELLHVRHRDLLWNWAALAVQSIHWFNPLVWLVVARFQADRELRCDAGALALLSPQERLAYGHTLLRVQETFFAPPAVAGLAPCVRNHPTLRQRILMIAEPNRNRPWLQAVFAAAFGILTCYAFTTAGAAEEEKNLPPKERTRETNRGSREAEREGDGPRRERESVDGKIKEGEKKEGERSRGSERDGDKPRTGERDGDKPRTGEKDGDKPRAGERDGDKPRTGERDGDKPRTGARDGEKPRTGAADGDKPRTGERDGEKPRTGPRDGEGVKTGVRDGERKPGMRDGEGGRSREGAPVKSAPDGRGTSLVLRVTDAGSAVYVGEEKVPMNRLRGFLQGYLAEHSSAKVIVTGDPDVPYKSLTGTVDAVRDNGNKNVSIQAP